MKNRTAASVISTTKTKFGYVIRKEIWATGGFDVIPPEDSDADTLNICNAIADMPDSMVMETCYTNNGDWIGDVETAEFLCKTKGITPEHRSETPPWVLRPCSIGFCEKERKWYGWSHRAIYGFGVGSSVKWGDIAYKAPNAGAFMREMIEFFYGDEFHKGQGGKTDAVDPDGVRGIEIWATYTDDVPNEKLRGTTARKFWPYPDTWGRGEWVADTLEDARQMAIDFADAVS